jgi:hypothetical protein
MKNARKLVLAILAILPALALAACCEEGSGVMARETRQVESWDRLVLDVPGTVRVVQGPATPLRLHTDDNLIDRVVTRVQDGRLEVRTDDGCCVEPTALTIEVSTEDVRGLTIDGDGAIVLPKPVDAGSLELSIDGSGSIEAAAIRADRVALDIDGSGELDLVIDAAQISTTIDGSGAVLLAGTAGRHDVSIDGSGDVEASALATGETHIEIDGSGDCAVAADDALVVSIDGSGDVAYCGDPSLTESIDGSGSVHRASRGCD